MSNKKTGNRFENYFASVLADKGFWVHLLQQNASGQPADVIASRDGKAVLIDCKHCEGDRFLLSRVEENQALAMKKWESCGNGCGWFAIFICGEIRMVSYRRMQYLIDKGIKSLTWADLRDVGETLSWWLFICGFEDK